MPLEKLMYREIHHRHGRCSGAKMERIHRNTVGARSSMTMEEEENRDTDIIFFGHAYISLE
jgi:hypothetical protein